MFVLFLLLFLSCVCVCTRMHACVHAISLCQDIFLCHILFVLPFLTDSVPCQVICHVGWQQRSLFLSPPPILSPKHTPPLTHSVGLYGDEQPDSLDMALSNICLKTPKMPFGGSYFHVYKTSLMPECSHCHESQANIEKIHFRR